MSAPLASWQAQARNVSASCERFLPSLIGVYVHGSAALGGFNEGSDLDILVVADSGRGAAGLGRSLLDAGALHDLELSVVSTAAAQHPQEPWPFLLHVTGAEQRAQPDAGAGDPDLIAHYAVTRAAGIALRGPEPARVIGSVDREQLLRYLADELQWGLDRGDERYAVLNACRAVAYLGTGRLLSKIDGARWWLEARGPEDIVTRARESQATAVDLGPVSTRARAFVTDRIEELRRGLQ